MPRSSLFGCIPFRASPTLEPAGALSRLHRVPEGAHLNLLSHGIHREPTPHAHPSSPHYAERHTAHAPDVERLATSPSWGLSTSRAYLFLMAEHRASTTPHSLPSPCGWSWTRMSIEQCGGMCQRVPFACALAHARARPANSGGSWRQLPDRVFSPDGGTHTSTASASPSAVASAFSEFGLRSTSVSLYPPSHGGRCRRVSGACPSSAQALPTLSQNHEPDHGHGQRRQGIKRVPVARVK